MKLRPRLDALEATRKPEASRLVICSTPEEAQLIDKPGASVIITGVPRPPKDSAT